MCTFVTVKEKNTSPLSKNGEYYPNPTVLERQLHEQYAINNNANLSSVITLIVSLLAVLGAYGHILFNTSNDFSRDFIFKKEEFYTMEALILVTIASLFVLYIIWRVCLYQGVAQRREQFITYAIRVKHYGGREEYKDKAELPRTDKNKEENIWPIFISTYSPFEKKGMKMVQGLYAKVMWFSCIASIGILFITTLKICHSKTSCNCDQCFLLVILYVIVAVVLLCVFCTWCKEKERYKDFEQAYGAYNNTLVENKKKVKSD